MQELGNNRQKKKGQHYLPRFYLKHFSTERNGEYYIWCYNKKTGNIFETNIAKVCKENWFYGRDNFIENGLSILEGHHSTIYRIIEENPIYALTEIEKRTIMEFVYVTHARTRRARDNTMDINEEVQYDENFRKKTRYIFPHVNIEDAIEEMKRTFQLSNIFGFKIPSYNYDPKADEKREEMMDYDYFIYKNNTDIEFYTSDHPIPQFDISDEEGYKVLFPLTPDMSLVLYNGQKLMDKFPTQIIPASEGFVKKANEAMIKVAHKYIYSRNNDFEFVRQFLQAKSNED